jgi:hypothetical protein
VTGVTVRTYRNRERKAGRWQVSSGLSCGLGLAHHLAFITSRMRSKSSREEYSRPCGSRTVSSSFPCSSACNIALKFTPTQAARVAAEALHTESIN